MRNQALKLGYSLNEKGLYHIEKEGRKIKKGEKIKKEFLTEKDIFEFLKMKYLKPIER